MVETYRKTIAQLTDREYALYRAIAVELEDLQRSIRREDYGGLDVAELAVAMRDRRFLVEWLRELRLPPASDFNDCGLTAEVEIQILKDHSYKGASGDHGLLERQLCSRSHLGTRILVSVMATTGLNNQFHFSGRITMFIPWGQRG